MKHEQNHTSSHTRGVRQQRSDPVGLCLSGLPLLSDTLGGLVAWGGEGKVHSEIQI